MGEVSGLVAPAKNRPDGVRSLVSIATEDGVDFIGSLELCFFHGDYYHGGPPGLEPPQCVDDKCPKELYAKTMADMGLFKAKGYEVKYVWESNFAKAAPILYKQVLARNEAWKKKVRDDDQAASIPLESVLEEYSKHL